MKAQKNQDGWWRFLDLCHACKNARQLDELLKLFLTIEEQEAIAGRYLIVKELLRGKKTQREMADELKVSIAKITRGSNMLKTTDDKLKRFIIETIL
jgi:TrpR family trp operon transcriptional repressor